MEKRLATPSLPSLPTTKLIDSPQSYLLPAAHQNHPEQLIPTPTQKCKDASEFSTEIIRQCYPTLQQWIEQNMNQENREKEQRSFYFMQFFADLKNFTKGIWNQVTNTTNSVGSPIFDNWYNRQSKTSTVWENPVKG